MQKSVSLKVRARLGTAAHLCEVVVLEWRAVPSCAEVLPPFLSSHPGSAPAPSDAQLLIHVGRAQYTPVLIWDAPPDVTFFFRAPLLFSHLPTGGLREFCSFQFWGGLHGHTCTTQGRLLEANRFFKRTRVNFHAS